MLTLRHCWPRPENRTGRRTGRRGCCSRATSTSCAADAPPERELHAGDDATANDPLAELDRLEEAQLAQATAARGEGGERRAMGVLEHPPVDELLVPVDRVAEGLIQRP